MVTLAIGTHQLTLTVTDDGGATATDTVLVSVREMAMMLVSPTADAGPDRTVMDTNGDGMEMVTLDGSGSSDPDGMIVRYVGSSAGQQIATGQQPTVTLTTGVHTITLTVIDDSALSALSALRQLASGWPQHWARRAAAG